MVHLELSRHSGESFRVSFKTGFWRKCRLAFRCVRFAAWLLVLAVLGAFLWCNRVGLPDFLKARIVATLHERGVELEFSRMRLSLIRGLVADNVRAGEGRAADRARFAARSVQLELDYHALRHGRWQLAGLILRDGDFLLPLSPTNVLTLTNLQAELRFGPDATWSLDNFRADFAGAQITISGEVAHAPEAANWPLFSGGGTTNRDAATSALKDFSDALRQIHFQGAPQLRLTLSGDARDLHTIGARLEATAAGVATPWFTAQDFQAGAQLTAPVAAPTNSDAALGFWTNLQPFQLAWSIKLGELRSKQLNADGVVCGGVWAAPELAVTNFSARIGGGQFQSSATLDVATRRLVFTNDANFDLHAVAALLPENARQPLARLAWQQPPVWQVAGSLRLAPWTNAANNRLDGVASSVQLRGKLAGTNIVAAGAVVDRVRTHFSCTDLVWDLPDLTLAQGRTELVLSGQASAATQNFHFLITGQMDAASLRPLLGTNDAINGFAALTAAEPLGLALDVSGNLRTLEGLAATGHVALARTQLQFGGQGNAAAKTFQGRISGQFDVANVRPFLTATNVANGFSILTTSEPLALALDVGGSWRTLASLTATGRVALTNFAVRGQTIDSVAGRLDYADGTLHLLQPELWRAQGEQMMTADEVALDFKTLVITFTNGFSTMDPVVMTSAIGPKTARLMEPYHFLKLPTARVNGCLPLRNMTGPRETVGTDMRFDIVKGVPFQWLKLNSPNMTGTIRWMGPELILTNLQAELYGGTGHGDAYFDFRPPHEGADYHFTMTVTNVNLHQFAADMSSPSNRLEGTLAGQIVITNADTRFLESWNGFGTVRLRDGLLWDYPIFGVLSPVLNTFSAGLGNSRATEATARYIITNGVIFSDSLVIHSTMMRLSYTGTVDMRQQVQARVTAHLLRDIWVVGPLVSTLLWPVSKVFECEVAGTLDQPKATPILLPAKLLLVPLHPISTLKELFLPSTSTNAPTR